MKIRTVLLVAVPVLLCAAGIFWYRSADMPHGIPAASDTDREIYLFTQGFKGELLETQEITVPAPGDDVTAAYAALQKAQELPFAHYAGQPAVRYVYRLEQTELYAELLCADGILIGAMCWDPAVQTMLDAGGRPFTG